MPTIKRQAPLLVEGEYCGQARKVTMEWNDPKPKADGAKGESIPIFRIPLHIPGGQMITTFARVTDSTGWVFEQICKSGELIPPAGEEFNITADDLEGRRFYFGVEHKTYNGAPIANVKFHAQSYAEQVNPKLVGITFPNEAPRGITLREPAPAAPQAKPEEPASGSSPVPKQPAPTQPPTAKISMEELETLSDEDFQSALEYAKEQRRKKE